MFEFLQNIDWSSHVEKIAGAAALAIGGAAYAWFKGWWSLNWRKRKVKRADGTHFTILVAVLDRDTGEAQTRHIIDSLLMQFADATDGARMSVIRYPKALKLPDAGDQHAAIAAAEKTGRKWLRKKNADILIWGHIATEDKTTRLRLRFTTPDSGSDALKSYKLTEDLELPANFGADFGAVLAASAATGIRPVYERTGEAIAALIAPVVQKLKPLAENPPATFDDESKARLWHAYAVGEQRLGDENGDNARLETAIAYYRKVLSVWTREKVPLAWATTQNKLGNALQTLGERESGTAHLEDAVTAYRAALLERTREQVPLDWATTQNNLGTALQTLGERESGTARLEDAVTAYRAVLLERTREKVPLCWAMTQNNLGNALSTLDKRESGTARLEEAATAYRAALQELTREKVPLYWAMTQNNLGNALGLLGERESGTTRLEEAVTACREALQERTREKVPLDWAMTQNNLGLVLRTMSERVPENAAALLHEARAAMANALEVFQQAQVSYYIEHTQNNLALIDDAIARLDSGDTPSTPPPIPETVAPPAAELSPG